MLPVHVIQLTQGKYSIIDPEDSELTAPFKWFAIKAHEPSSDRWYAGTKIPYPDGPQGVKQRTLRLHTLITGYSLVDHANRNGLDNRRINLRDATRSQNNANGRKRPTNTSGHVGVVRYEQHSRWRVYVACKYYGSFMEFDEAVSIYHATAVELWGKFAPTCCSQERKQ